MEKYSEEDIEIDDYMLDFNQKISKQLQIESLLKIRCENIKEEILPKMEEIAKRTINENINIEVEEVNFILNDYFQIHTNLREKVISNQNRHETVELILEINRFISSGVKHRKNNLKTKEITNKNPNSINRSIKEFFKKY